MFYNMFIKLVQIIKAVWSRPRRWRRHHIVGRQKQAAIVLLLFALTVPVVLHSLAWSRASVSRHQRSLVPDISLTYLEGTRQQKTERDISNHALTVTHSRFPRGIDSPSSLDWFYPIRRVFAVDCAQLMNLTSPSPGTTYGQWQLPHTLTSDRDVLKATANCTDFLHTYPYVMDPLTKQEEEFPIAYVLVVHQGAAQVERLLRALYRPQNIYCLHVDLKASALFHMALRSVVRCFSNVFIAATLHIVVWSKSSQVDATLSCMKDLVARGVRWRYLLNLAGQEFPLRTNREIVHILSTYHPYNEVQVSEKGRRLHRIIYQRTGYNMTHTGKQVRPPPPHNITMYTGSTYGAFTREFVEYLLHDPVSLDLWAWLKGGKFTDELYWNTLNNNPHLHAPGGRLNQHPGGPTAFRTVLWGYGNMTRCRGKVVRGVCVFGIGDLPWLVRQAGIIANKFYGTRDAITNVNMTKEEDWQQLATTYDCVEEWFWNRTAAEYRQLKLAAYPGLNMKYYKRVRKHWLISQKARK